MPAAITMICSFPIAYLDGIGSNAGASRSTASSICLWSLFRDRISTSRSVARPISSRITEKMVAIERPRILDASGDTLPSLSSTMTLAIP